MIRIGQKKPILIHVPVIKKRLIRTYESCFWHFYILKSPQFVI